MSRTAILLLASLAIAFSLPLKHYSEFSSLSTKTYKQSNAVCPNVSADGVNYIGRAGQLPASASLADGACSWYKDSTCCDPADAQFIRNSATLDLETSRCRYLIVMGACSVCSPNAGKLYSTSTGIPICKSYCERIYAACKAQRNLNTGEFYVDSTKPVDEFCNGTVDSEDPTECFNTGSVYVPIMPLILLFVAIVSLL